MKCKIPVWEESRKKVFFVQLLLMETFKLSPFLLALYNIDIISYLCIYAPYLIPHTVKQAKAIPIHYWQESSRFIAEPAGGHGTQELS